MSDTAAIAAFRFGYGLPLPEKAATDAASLIKTLQREDAAAQKWPGLGMAKMLANLPGSAGFAGCRQGKRCGS